MKPFIEIPTGDPDLLQTVMDDFNKRYTTDFLFKGAEDRDGVLFALVEQGTAEAGDVFQFGFYYGMLVKEKRMKGEIDY